MNEQPKGGWWRRAWNAIDAYGNVVTVAQLVAASVDTQIRQLVDTSNPAIS